MVVEPVAALLLGAVLDGPAARSMTIMNAWGKALGFGLAAVLISSVFLLWLTRFVQAEHTVYSWDHEVLWVQAAGLAKDVHQGLFGGLHTLGRSMHRTYNDASAIPIALAMLIGGTGRVFYVLSIGALIVIPATLAVVLLFVRRSGMTWMDVVFVLLAFLSVLCIPVPWGVAIQGMTDVAGIVMACIALDLAIRTDPASEDLVRWFAIGAAIGITALLKRWYLFWGVGLGVVVFLDMAMCAYRETRANKWELASIFSRIFSFLAVGLGVVSAYSLSMPLAWEILRTDYSKAYAGFQFAGGPMSAILLNIEDVCGGYGILAVLLSIGCFAACLFLPDSRRAAFYLFVPGWLALVDFSRMQSMGPQHLLLLYVAVVVTPVFLAGQLFSSERINYRRWAWCLLLATLLLNFLGFESVFGRSAPFGNSLAQRALPTTRMQPEQRHDISQMEDLLNYVAAIVTRPGAAPPNSVYLLSASQLLNWTHLYTLSFQLQRPLLADGHICVTNDVDARDGFPDDLLQANVVLVADPIQTVLPSGEKIVTVPAREFMEGGPFAHAFQRDSRIFQMDEGIKIYVFERVRPSTAEEVAELRDEIGVPSGKQVPN